VVRCDDRIGRRSVNWSRVWSHKAVHADRSAVKIAVTDDVVPLEHAPPFVAGQFHRDTLRHAAPDWSGRRSAGDRAAQEKNRAGLTRSEASVTATCHGQFPRPNPPSRADVVLVATIERSVPVW